MWIDNLFKKNDNDPDNKDFWYSSDMKTKKDNDNNYGEGYDDKHDAESLAAFSMGLAVAILIIFGVFKYSFVDELNLYGT